MKLRPVAVAVAVGLGLALAGCATPATATRYEYRYPLLAAEATGAEQLFDEGKRTYVRFQGKPPAGVRFFQRDGNHCVLRCSTRFASPACAPGGRTRHYRHPRQNYRLNSRPNARSFLNPKRACRMSAHASRPARR